MNLNSYKYIFPQIIIYLSIKILDTIGLLNHRIIASSPKNDTDNENFVPISQKLKPLITSIKENYFNNISSTIHFKSIREEQNLIRSSFKRNVH